MDYKIYWLSTLKLTLQLWLFSHLFITFHFKMIWSWICCWRQLGVALERIGSAEYLEGDSEMMEDVGKESNRQAPTGILYTPLPESLTSGPGRVAATPSGAIRLLIPLHIVNMTVIVSAQNKQASFKFCFMQLFFWLRNQWLTRMSAMRIRKKRFLGFLVIRAWCLLFSTEELSGSEPRSDVYLKEWMCLTGSLARGIEHCGAVWRGKRRVCNPLRPMGHSQMSVWGHTRTFLFHKQVRYTHTLTHTHPCIHT